MKRNWLMGIALCAVASPAMAMKITNLDTVPHRILFEAAGTRTERVIAPDASEYIVGQPSGRLSLLSAPAQPAQGVVQADGLLSGLIGNGRNQDMPADIDNNYVIWPGGKIVLQQHVKSHRGNH